MNMSLNMFMHMSIHMSIHMSSCLYTNVHMYYTYFHTLVCTHVHVYIVAIGRYIQAITIWTISVWAMTI